MNKIDELLKIKELLDSGIISEKEFIELKNNLNSIEKNISEFQPNAIKKCPICNSVINDNEPNCKTCNVLNSEVSTREALEDNIIPESNSKMKYVVYVLIIIFLLIGLNFYQNNSNKKGTENNGIPPDTTSIIAPDEKVTNEISNTDTLTTDEKLMMPAVQKPESQQEVDEGGDYNDDTSENIDSNGSTNTSKSDIEESVNNIDNGNGIINHIVIKGETMSSIAKKYNINSNELYKLYNAQPKTYEFYKAYGNPEKSLKPNTLIIIPSNLIRSK